MGGQVGNFFLAGYCQLPDRRDDSYFGSQNLEDNVEAYLIIAGTGTSVGDV